MFTTSRILAVSLLATLASALPTTLPKLSKDQALKMVRQATGGAVYTSCSVPNTVAITFDDGPYTYNTDIVNTLGQYNAKATFFVNGNNYQCIYTPENEQRLKTAFAADHQIASHTWAHLDWTTLSNDQLLSEMTRTDDALTKILGVKPAFVRPPYGSYNAGSQEVAASNGQSIVIWDFDSGDSVGESEQQSETDYQNIANQQPSSILTLNHETYETTAHEVLPFALNALQAKGYQFVTVAECLGGMAPYLEQGEPQARDDSWTC
ncbi:carbohydrate esterase family 4 protein [Tulasnella calospora MUT 4182]|uniref:Carbohydrate esterase family 4 protein n=1 Tax=Tulasnella calospora MUT 4182 TaxID=1051891 RepID=A0A0C3LQE3_9AGAM|nr:carbohydrate esterase family 4 protein [Tulasnella calospora MUT 4182]